MRPLIGKRVNTDPNLIGSLVWPTPGRCATITAATKLFPAWNWQHQTENTGGSGNMKPFGQARGRTTNAPGQTSLSLGGCRSHRPACLIYAFMHRQTSLLNASTANTIAPLAFRLHHCPLPSCTCLPLNILPTIRLLFWTTPFLGLRLVLVFTSLAISKPKVPVHGIHAFTPPRCT